MHGLTLFVAAIGGLAVSHRAMVKLPVGIPRLMVIIPILPIFFLLPWSINIYHLRAILSFIFLWTVPSKLLLLCWDAGIDYPSSGFLYFVTIVMLPVRVKGKKMANHAEHAPVRSPFWWQLIAVIVILNIYSYRNGLPIWAIYVLYACHMYFGLELMLGGLAKLATACFGVELDPQFNNPFMSASLSEFWGRRWNLIVTTILRSTVYNPALQFLMRAEMQKRNASGMLKPVAGHHGSKFNISAASEHDQSPQPKFRAADDKDVATTHDSLHDGNQDNHDTMPRRSCDIDTSRHESKPSPTKCEKTSSLAFEEKLALSSTWTNSNDTGEHHIRGIHHENNDETSEHATLSEFLHISNPSHGFCISGHLNSNPSKPLSKNQALDLPANSNPIITSHGNLHQEQLTTEKPSLRARAGAMLATFVVSGLVHELIFYYINKSRATGEVTAFFILHGFATAMEVLLRRTVLSKVKLPKPISIIFTMAFLYVTAAWLFMPPLTRAGADINTIAEYQRLQSAVISVLLRRT